MFYGEYHHNLDTKNRIIIPAKFREILGISFIVTRGLDGCLTVYTHEQWNTVMDNIKKLPNSKAETRMFIRFLTSGASECEVDKNGRVQLPSILVKEFNIEKECVIIGNGDHIEIWSNNKWESYMNKANESFENIAESLGDFSF